MIKWFQRVYLILMKIKKTGILGYGNTGQFLAEKILNDPLISKQFELLFVWNRSETKLHTGNLPSAYHLTGDLSAILDKPQFKEVDIIIEVCHPAVVNQHGAALLQKADLFIASVTAMANKQTELALNDLINKEETKNSIYLPAGAAWGIHDIQKMAQLNTIEDLQVTMKFNADALKLNEPLNEKLAAYVNDASNTEELILYKGDVRTLAKLAPNNVNTMTCLALAAHTIGLDKTQACLIAQKQSDAHIVSIEVTGRNGFNVKTERHNPAKKGAVTGDETYHSFLASLLKASANQKGIHFC